MGSKLIDQGRKLMEIEKERGRLETAVREAREALKARRRELCDAEKALALPGRDADSGGWIERRSARQAGPSPR